MEIYSNSFITGSGNYFINQEDFDYNFKFTDSNSQLYYLISKYDYITDKEIVITQGKLSGYNSDVDYQYKLDLERFINIKNNNINWNDDFYSWENPFTYFKIIKENICKLNIYFTNSDTVLNLNPTAYTTHNNGTIEITGTIISYYNFNPVFYDKYTDNLNSFPTTKTFYNDSWFAIGCYTPMDQNRTIVQQLDKNDNIIYNQELFGTSEGNLRQFFIYILTNCVKIRFSTLNNPQWETHNVKNNCKNTPIFYWNDGVIDTIYCEGLKKPLTNITKETIKLGNKTVPIRINTEKQYKLNTGFLLEEQQMFNLYKSPTIMLNADNFGYVQNPARNYMGSTNNIVITKIRTGAGNATLNVAGYNSPTSGINLFNETNDDSLIFRFTINDLNPITEEGYYYLSFWWKHVAGTNLLWSIDVNDVPFNNLSSSTADNVWKKIEGVVYVNDLINNYGFIDFQAIGGDPNCAINISDIQFGKGQTIYPYSQNYTETGQDRLKFTYYNLDDKTFDGYTGKKLSEKNTELTLIDVKEYSTKTNIKLNFFD